MRIISRRLTALGGAVAIALVFAGCGSASGGDTGSGGDDKSITLGVVSGWNDMTDISNLYKYVLEQNGYTVDIEELSEIATMYVAASEGDVDAFSTSPSTIHKQYWDQYGEDLEIVGSYYEEASIYLAVPDYVTDVQSIDDLPAATGELNGTIVSIEPGAGVVSTAKDVTLPKYGLDTYQVQTSSTAAMLASLKEAVDNEKPIVVTAWSPWWANSTFDLRKLDDPKKAYGDPYTLDMVGTKGFAEAHPEVAKMMKGLVLTEDQFNTLDNAVYQEFEAGQEQEAVASWLKENPDILKQMEASLKG